MRTSAALTVAAVVGLLCLAGGRSGDTCAVTLRLIDAETGRELPGVIRVTDMDEKAVEVPELLSRGLGLGSELPISRWSVLPGETTVHLPQAELQITALSGLETEKSTRRIDLRGKQQARVTIPLIEFYDASRHGFRSANTHLHLQKIDRQTADRYLLEVPKVDRLDLLFLSYLERAVADREYISNDYTKGDLTSLTKKSGVVFGNGEEHRHNFTGFGEGYGHVMLLDIKKLIQPVSIGPGIMQMGTDGIPLQRGIDTARRDGATIIWCHNNWGMEAVCNLLTGRVDAQNIFDGGTHGSYKESFYRYLNAGLQVPFSTGTDWFMYDFSRVYADLKGDVTVEGWLDALASGRTYITNGPLLEFHVAGRGPGEVVALNEPQKLTVKGRAVGRIDFRRIELVRNGTAIATSKSRPVGGHFEAELTLVLQATEPCWLALRTPPPPVKDDPQLQQPVPQNEYGRDLFAHTSAVHVEIGGHPYFDRRVAEQLLAEIERNRDVINEKGMFADEQERQRVLDVYRDGIAAMRQHIQQAANPAGRRE